MEIKTYGTMRKEVEKELDIENEEFVKADEMVNYANDAIADAEAEILKLNEDYFLKRGTINLVSGTDEYQLPADIYAQKIRAIIYSNGSRIYTIRRMREKDAFENIERINLTPTNTEALRYMLLNNSAFDPLNPATTGFRILMVPTPLETIAAKIWYIRQAARIPLVSAGSQAASDARVVDIPQFYAFIKAAMKVKCVSKEGHPKWAEIVKEFEYQRKQMIDTLTQRVQDEDNQVEMDMTHYLEHT